MANESFSAEAFSTDAFSANAFQFAAGIVQPVLSVYTPGFRSIDAKSIADQYNRGIPLDADYEVSGGRKFYQDGS